MRIERINENQIRCTLSNFDLSVRDLNLSELAYGSEKARSLFREMIQRASNEVGFDAEDIPLMVEAIPLANESVMLIISKIEDPEELDTRFSKFSPVDEEEDGWNALAAERLEGAESLLNLTDSPEKMDKTPSKDTPGKEHAEAAPGEALRSGSPLDAPVLRIFQFKTLDQVCEAAVQTGEIFTGSSVLYKNPSSGQYYLVLKKDGADDRSFNQTCNTLSEFGTRLKGGPASEAYYAEHYETIVRQNALGALSKL